MATDIVQRLSKEFLDEARLAPDLFRDLAKMELYISESYRERTIIELLQNADDCNSFEFEVYEDFGYLIVTNDGSLFTEQDLKSLCRSGASTKKRSSSTIGYRGIGFKSVVGIASEVILYSGDIEAYFSKNETKSKLSILDDVPLIRIPHVIADDKSRKYKKDGITTFIFSDAKARLTDHEINQLQPSSLIFLKNLNKIKIRTEKTTRTIELVKKSESVRINDSYGNNEDWLIISSENLESIAIKLKDGKLVPADASESLIHSFLPTLDHTGCAMRFNGDFSTDPSRKHVDFDIESTNAFIGCVNLIIEFIERALESNHFNNIFSCIVNTSNTQNRQRLKECFYQQVKKSSDTSLFKNLVLNTRLRPDWLNVEDYFRLSTIAIVPRDLYFDFENINDFLKWIGCRVISLEDIIDTDITDKISSVGLVEILSKIATATRFSSNDSLVTKSKNLKLFKTIAGNKSSVCEGPLLITDDFISLLKNNSRLDDIVFFLKRINLHRVVDLIKPTKDIDIPQRKAKEINGYSESERKTILPNSRKFVFSKWRSAEVNVREFFENKTEVVYAKDVSKLNVGYDIEVKYKSGRVCYFEVKSVKTINEPIEITNNELAIGRELAGNYYIAIHVSSDEPALFFIENPINNLHFDKRIKAVAWVCDDYMNSGYLTAEEFLC